MKLPSKFLTRCEKSIQKLAGSKSGGSAIVVHRYFSVKDDIIWDVVINKVPELLTVLKTEIDT